MLASLLRERRVGSLHGWCLGLLPWIWLYLGFVVPLGLDTISLWQLDVRGWHGLVLGPELSRIWSARLQRCADHHPATSPAIYSATAACTSFGGSRSRGSRTQLCGGPARNASCR